MPGSREWFYSFFQYPWRKILKESVISHIIFYLLTLIFGLLVLTFWIIFRETQDLFLTLGSGIISGRTWGGPFRVLGIEPICCPIVLDPSFYLLIEPNECHKALPQSSCWGRALYVHTHPVFWFHLSFISLSPPNPSYYFFSYSQYWAATWLSLHLDNTKA